MKDYGSRVSNQLLRPLLQLFPVAHCAGDDGAGPSRPTASVALSQGRPVLEGIPVRWEDIWDTPTAASFYFSTVVHIPGEIEDPLTLSKLSKLNGYLLFFDEDVKKEISVAYTQAIQRELDQTAAVLLPAKLDSFIVREHDRFLNHIRGGKSGEMVASPGKDRR